MSSTTMTTSDIQALRNEAVQAGDQVQIGVCDRPRRFSLMDLSTTETTMQTTPQTPLHLIPGAILASPQGRGTITIVSVDACEIVYLDESKRWQWPRRHVERVLDAMGFALTAHEDPAVLAERVLLAEANYRARVAA